MKPFFHGSVCTSGGGPGLQNRRGVWQKLQVGSIPIHSRPFQEVIASLGEAWGRGFISWNFTRFMDHEAQNQELF